MIELKIIPEFENLDLEPYRKTLEDFVNLAMSNFPKISGGLTALEYQSLYGFIELNNFIEDNIDILLEHNK